MSAFFVMLPWVIGYGQVFSDFVKIYEPVKKTL